MYKILLGTVEVAGLIFVHMVAEEFSEGRESKSTKHALFSVLLAPHLVMSCWLTIVIELSQSHCGGRIPKGVDMGAMAGRMTKARYCNTEPWVLFKIFVLISFVFIYFGLCWAFVAVQASLLVVASRGYSQ